MTLLDNRLSDIKTPLGDGLIACVGSTPLLTLRHVTGHLPQAVKIFAKAEWLNPSGSVKDRPALKIIQIALANGDLAEGKRLLDSTSGNMGISYATLGALLGIPVTLTIPASASPERFAILRALGTELILTDPTEGSDGAILVARKLASEEPHTYWYANQYNNPGNWQAHYETTGPEIVADTNGEVTHFIAGLGTSGTLMGTGRYLREQIPTIKIVALQPDAAFNGLEGLKHMPSAIKPGIYDDTFADEILEIHTEEARDMTLRLAREEGLFVGISSGAAMVATIRVAERLDRGVLVTVFPDSGSKYLSDTSLWGGG